MKKIENYKPNKYKKMTANFLKISVLTLSLGFGFTSCNKEDNGANQDGGNAENTTLKGEITQNRVLDASQTYILSGALVVKNGATLTIPAGTIIKANQGFSSYILVAQGGKINIEGTAEKPVKMTANGEGKAGFWGGLIINGKASLSGNYTAGTPEGSTEIDSNEKYGGNIDNDSSGRISYLILEYTGARSNADIEHNGLTLNGVGNGTSIENVFVYECADDGIELFGGSVNVKNILCVNTDDDMFDMTQGWSGTLENAYGVWEEGFSSGESDPRGVEADGNLDGLNSSHIKQSDFKINNLTIDLKLTQNTSKEKTMDDVIKIRRGANALITNALVKGKGQVKDLVDLKDSKGKGTAKITLTSQLASTISGVQINKDTDNTSEVTINDTQTGCDTKNFSWTKYNF